MFYYEKLIGCAWRRRGEMMLILDKFFRFSKFTKLHKFITVQMPRKKYLLKVKYFRKNLSLLAGLCFILTVGNNLADESFI